MALLTSTHRATPRGGIGPWLALVLVLGLGTAALPAQPDANPEYQVKAAFLFNFAQFVDWPAAAFANATTPISIGVLGVDPLGPSLDEIIQGESVGGRKLAVKRYNRIEEVEGCHILFISNSESAHLERILAELKGRPVLTVSDAEGFALRGVMIRFLTENGRIRLRVNLDATRAAGLQLSSKLLRRAEIVTTRKKP